MKDFHKLITTEPYDFLRTNPCLGERIILLTLGGSHAYGTNMETSDVDIRGCALNSPSDLLGLSSFEQVVEKETDTTIYSFNKFVRLLAGCNPNIIEMLGCLPEHYVYLSDNGRKLIENRKLFLSQRASATFSGYATQALRKIKTAFIGDDMTQAELEKHLKYAMENAISTFQDRFPSFKEEELLLYLVDSGEDNQTCELLADFSMKGIPVRQLNGVMEAMISVTKNFDKLGQRNRKRDDVKLAKHAAHLVRLYLEGLDVLEKEEIITYRGQDLDLLMSIRRGEYQKDDGSFIPEFYELVDDLERRFKYAKENTSLPPKPDLAKLEELVMEINMEALHV